MTHADRVVNHVKTMLGDSKYAHLVSNSIMNDVPYEEFDSVFDALEDELICWSWVNQILTAYRIELE